MRHGVRSRSGQQRAGQRRARGVGLWAALPVALALAFAAEASARADELAADAPAAQDERAPVWVFFTDKGVAPGPALAAALTRREAELPERTRVRRARRRAAAPTLADGRALELDARDLPLDPDRVAAVLATGARERARSRWLNAISVDATPQQRRALASLEGVARVADVRRAARQPVSIERGAQEGPADDEYFGMTFDQLELMGAVYLQRCGLTGAGVVLGVQDTGFVLEHETLEGLEVLGARDFINGDDDVGVEDGDPDGQINHGTLVLSAAAGSLPGTFMGAAPGVQVLLSKTEDVSEEVMAEEDYFVAGLEWQEEQGADIFTASLGYFDWYSQDDFDGETAVTTQAVNVAAENGLIMFVAMGNAGPAPTTLGAPADAAGIISIGALDPVGDVAVFSSRGPTTDGRIKPDVSARGVAVAIASPGTVDEYGAANGTSLATPLAAGLAALLLEAYPELTGETMAALLRETATQADSPDNDIGWGLIDGYAAGAEYCNCTDVDQDGHLDVACGGDDCDDGRADVYPGAPEVCDGRLNDCGGAPLEGDADLDGDGVLGCGGDCDDENADVTPGNPELCGDGLDNDCVDGDAECPEPPMTTGPGPTETDGEVDSGVDLGSEGDSAELGTGSGSEGDSGGQDGDKGCACSSGGARGGGLLGALGLFGLLGLTRRRR